MLKFVFTVAGLLALSTFGGCAKSNEETVKQAENDVFAIHDEIMPKIDDVMKLQKQLKQRVSSLDSLKSAGSAAAAVRTNEEKDQALRLSRSLTVADSLMMGWMSQYNGDTLAKLPSDQALRYLAGQKDQISDVKTKVNSSIAAARQFLGKP